MIGKIFNGILTFAFLVGAGFAFFGSWELTNNNLTFWVMLALSGIYGHRCFEHKKLD